jgi:hypothetical protein
VVVGAILGKNFRAGLRGQVPVPAWQGRLWFAIVGGSLILSGLDGLLGQPRTGPRHFLERVFRTLDYGYEMLIGVAAILGGSVFLWPGSVVTGNGKVNPKVRYLFGAAALFVGAMLLWDALLRVRIGR